MSRRHVVRRSLAAAALVPLALTAVAACGSEQGDSGRAADPAAASSASSAAAAPAPEEGATVAPADFTALMTSSFDAITTAHATLKSDMMGGGLTGEGDVDYSSDPPAASMVMSGGMAGDGKLESRLVDGVLYLNLGAMTDGKFAKLDLNDPNSPFGAQMADNMDPKTALASLGKALTKVTYVGEDQLGGGTARHYQATVDTAKMLGATGTDLPATGMPDSLDYDVWFDDQGRFEQFVVDLGNMGTTTTTLSDYGSDVSIEAPPADQITDKSPFAG